MSRQRSEARATGARRLYDEDILRWSEQQAELIRALGRRRDLPTAFDAEAVAEEIESVGRSELAAVKSLIRQVLLHLIKLAIEPESDAARHWEGEIVVFHAELTDRWAPSMAQRIDPDALWRSARDTATRMSRGTPAAARVAGLPEHAPLTLADLLAEPVEPGTLAARLSS
ncbi:DUF29 domain-containing protein [Rhodoplanes sp. TEM]|uniref:DUF29 domain-containing protein n=1 Tax=Rhodoplanes tepidamans TaxID=200616 RepID=A0ABT5JLL0_RHOTP|nr:MULTISPECIES: DUF29 domain-containing protein [Rhodoplanes]MDC7790071.1 DUF29 domain-containing protein [Rhodoplanes tepidamans]MDC7988178.1 DUF29 domain-containing protein [Rhodoplanes sp. TEM]MDQ0359263.1 hypothetical protein [Rhodoplanes tepidamans]